MTAIVEQKNNFNEILSKIKKLNPSYNDNEIIKSLSTYIFNSYYKKITELKLPKKIDRYNLKRIELQQIRQTKEKKSEIETLLEKNKNIEEYKQIQKGFSQLTQVHSSSDRFYLNKDTKSRNEINSADISEIENLNYNNIDDISKDLFQTEPELSHLDIDRKSNGFPYKLQEENNFKDKNYPNRLHDYTPTKPKIAEASEKIPMDKDIIARIKSIKVDIFEKKNPQRFNWSELSGIIDDDELNKDT